MAGVHINTKMNMADSKQDWMRPSSRTFSLDVNTLHDDWKLLHTRTGQGGEGGEKEIPTYSPRGRKRGWAVNDTQLNRVLYVGIPCALVKLME